jgi:integrase
VLTASETERLVEAVADPDPRYARLRTNRRYKALAFMGCWLGPRWNEAIGLRVCDIKSGACSIERSAL